MSYRLTFSYSTAALGFASLLALSGGGCDNSVQLGQGGTTASSSQGPTTTTTGATTGSGTTSTSSSTGAGGLPPASEPPPPPTGAPPGDGQAPTAFAFTKIYLGTTDRNGNVSPIAWQSYGFDIDHQVTTTDFSSHCKANAGASPADTFKDGLDGRDNSFGKSLVPIFKSAAMGADIEAAANAEILSGQRTSIVYLATLGNGASYDPVSAFYLRGEMGTPTAWQLQPEFLNGATADTAKAVFPQSYVNANTWVSGPGTIVLPILVGGIPLQLTIHSATIAMELDGAHMTATNGTISGVLDTEEFVAEVAKGIGVLGPSLCSGPTVDSILNRMRQASDIGKDGAQHPDQTCDGISIGIGFDAAATNLGPVGPPAQVIPNPCN